MEKNRSIAIRCAIFLCVLMVVISFVSYIAIPNSVTKKQIALYSQEAENSIDIAYIGSSSTYQFYDVMAVWETYGITSMCYVSSALPFELTTELMELAQENQNPKVYVIDLRSVMVNEFKNKYFGILETEVQKEAFISAIDLLPLSIEKINTILNTRLVEGEEYLYIFNLLYNHEGFVDGITSFVENGFAIDTLAYKGNVRLSYKVEDMTEEDYDFSSFVADESYELTDETIERLTELFEYCESNGLNAYYTFTPYVGARNVDDENIRREIGAFVQENGYPFYDFKADMDEMGLDITTDFYDKNHVNVYGAERYTLYAMEYILNEYEIVPEYDQKVIEDWNEEYDNWIRYYTDKSESVDEDSSELDEMEVIEDFE